MNQWTNESGMDRVIRVIVGIVLLALGWGGVVTGGWGVFLKIIGFVPLLTGLVGFCPAYALLKIRTNKA
ncbi:MAG TPA: DUF2892 domain-containing protein [Anaerolinea thermolimosa]|uniref:DUF2892 domain-containing protein n=1 Tax=Anaerolinea thermolimosa TaxID=229919 RepID=A0A3D1JFY9_9CHLR|nr:DUF2892 domain-containing protein [Anaerolinea thermolimosa]GAP05615.1 hypothetical protein ATHL_00456 [Anaerolinea thermolimosa]HCE17147.1 DUF2892 domain-containing protein [Anaerolinea thermolimosa]